MEVKNEMKSLKQVAAVINSAMQGATEMICAMEIAAEIKSIMKEIHL